MTNKTFTFTPADGAAVSLRMVEREDRPWFVAFDVIEAMGGDTNQTHNYLRPLGDDERLLVTRSTNTNLFRDGRGSSRMTLISESGLYKLVLRSDKPQARQFQDWVTREVLPAIRKDGSYVVGEEKVRTGEMTEDELVLRAMEAMQRKVARLTEERDRLARENAALGERVAALAPKAAVLDQHFAHGRLVSLARFARTLDGVNVNAVKRDLGGAQSGCPAAPLARCYAAPSRQALNIAKTARTRCAALLGVARGILEVGSRAMPPPPPRSAPRGPARCPRLPRMRPSAPP